MIIKEGYNGKDTIIRISAQPNNRCAELWIEQTGLSVAKNETLSYASVEELLDLKDEVVKALNEIIKGDKE